jgi:hypothetical protein
MTYLYEYTTMQAPQHFENDEPSYLDWIRNNPDGYVLNLNRRPQRNFLVLHRASCRDIRVPSPRRGPEQFTGGNYAKVCATDAESIAAWVTEKVPGALSFTGLCKRCRPDAPLDAAEMLRRTFVSATDQALRDGVGARRARLERANPKPGVRFVMTRVFVRNPDVVAEVLHRAQGRCETCHDEAPFNSRSTGEPYLEVHHRIPLADNGLDTVENAIALCPNCHRYCHYG